MTVTKTPSMHPSLTFHHCPNCAHPRKTRLEDSIACEACDYLFYLNPAVAAAGLILNEKNQMLFIVRGKNPAKGRWALVGGFVDCGESPEKALKRECQEEVGITIDAPSYLACYPNTYTYKSIAYPVLDLFFTAKECSPAESLVCDREEVSHVEWQDPWRFDPAQLAFPSMQRALIQWQKLNPGLPL